MFVLVHIFVYEFPGRICCSGNGVISQSFLKVFQVKGEATKERTAQVCIIFILNSMYIKICHTFEICKKRRLLIKL